MRAISVGILGLAVLAAPTSCIRLKSRPVHGYAPIVQMADNASWPIETWEKDPARKGPRPPKEPAPIVADAYFIAAKPGRLQELGIRTDQPFQILSAGEWARILAEALPEAAGRKVLLLPSGQRLEALPKGPPKAPAARLFLQRGMKFLLHPGINANVESPMPLLRYQYAGEADTGRDSSLDSQFMTVKDGTVLGIEAAREGGDFVLTRVEPRVVAYLGLRSVTARGKVDGEERELFWQEPAVLEGAGRVPSPCQIRLTPGQSVLVPLHHTLFLGRAKSRALAEPGTIREQYDEGTRGLRHPDPRGYPLRNEAFLLLTPKFVEPKEAPTDKP